MKQILTFILAVGICENSFPQYQRFIQPNTNLYDIKQQLDSYFQNQVDTTEGSEYAEYRKFLDFWEPRLFPHGDFDKYFKAEKALYSSNIPFANTDPWWEIGPTKKPIGGVGVGPIEFVTFYKNDPSKMLCGSTAGGLFYSTNGGTQWQHTGTDVWSTTSGVISAIFDLNDFHIWYAASSGQGRAGGAFIKFTGGIFRTTDDGQTWTRIAGPSELGSEWTIINKILIDPAPQNPGDVVLYAATSDGISKTLDADASNPSWTKPNIPFLPADITDPLFDINAINYNPTPIVYDMEFNPQNSQIIYATVKFTGDDNAPWPNTKMVEFWRLIQSNDGGATWFEIPNQPTVPFYQPDINKPYFENANNETIEVTNAPGAADSLYFALDPDRGEYVPSSQWHGQLWRLTVSTNNWVQIANNIHIYMGAGNGFGVNQFDPDEIYIANLIDFKKINFTGILNGGQTIIYNGEYHMDVEDLVGDPVNPNVVWMANHGGVYKSTNNGNQGSWQDRSDGIGNAWILRMATSYTDPSYVAMGLDHNWSMVSTSTYTNNWNPTWNNSFYTGDGLRPLIDHKDPHYMYFASHWGGWRFSNNYGIGSNLPYLPDNSPSWIGEGVLNKKTPSTLYRIILGSGNKYVIKRSFNRGQNPNNTIADFTQPPFNYSDYILWKLYTTEMNDDYLLVHVIDIGTSPLQHHLWRTKNANELNPANVQWEKLSLPDNRWPADVDFNFENSDISYITYSSTLFYSNSPLGNKMVFKMNYSNPSAIPQYTCPSGLCEDLTFNLPNTGISNDGFTLEKGSDGGMYVGTDFGVYYTNNKFLANGTGWQKLGTILPNVQCYGMEINYVINKIRVGTYGRGVWEHDLFCPPDFDLTFTTANSSNLSNTFQEAENNITVTANSGNINLTNFTARSGNEIIISATGNNEVVIGPNSALFIHNCNEPGNSFRQQNANPRGGNVTPYVSASTHAVANKEKKIYEGENVKYTYYPNPFTEHLHIDFLLDKSSPVLVSVYNSQGQIIEILAKGNYEAGEHTLRFSNPSVKPGIYFVRLDIGDKHYTKAILKTAAQ